MRDVSGRNRDEGGDRKFYAEDLALGERAEDDVIAYFAGIGKTRTLEQWARGSGRPEFPSFSRSHIEARPCRMPDLYDPELRVRVEVKWAAVPSYTFTDGTFRTRIATEKWVDYVWLDRTELPVYLCHIFESPAPPQVDIDRAGRSSTWTVPETYPSGFYKTRLRHIAHGDYIDEHDGAMWLDLRLLNFECSIRDFRAVIAKEQGA